MTRGTSLTVLLMGACMAAALAAPGLDADAASPGCIDANGASAHISPSTVLAAAPALATSRAGVSLLAAACAKDPAQVYRQWHQGTSKSGVDCLADSYGAVAQSR